MFDMLEAFEWRTRFPVIAVRPPIPIGEDVELSAIQPHDMAICSKQDHFRKTEFTTRAHHETSDACLPRAINPMSFLFAHCSDGVADYRVRA
jgi:hypothetical protein